MSNLSTTRAKATELSIVKVNIDLVRTAPFWHNEPALWFTTLETQNVISVVSSDLTMLGVIFLKLDAEIAKKMSNVLNNFPERTTMRQLERSDLQTQIVATPADPGTAGE